LLGMRQGNLFMSSKQLTNKAVAPRVALLRIQRRYVMGSSLENRLGNLIHEIQEIRKDIIIHKIEKVTTAQAKINAWKSLGEKISTKWDNVSAVEEISNQREKSW